MQVQGDLSHIKTYLIHELAAFYEMEVPPTQLSTRELNAQMVAITAKLEHEVAVYINRRDKIVSVSVGDTATVELPAFTARSEKRLSGIRCIHTHPSGDVRLSPPDLSSLKNLHFDVMAAIGETENGMSVYC